MAKRTQRPWHVVYSKDMGKWRVKKENGRYAKTAYKGKREAVKRAKREGKKQGVGVVVHRRNGTVQRGYTAEQCMHAHP